MRAPTLFGVAALAVTAVLVLIGPQRDDRPPARRSADAGGAVPAAVAPRSASPVRTRPPAWGPSPFGPAPPHELPLAAADSNTGDPAFVALITRFEVLRSRVLPMPGPRPELEHLARSLQAALPQRVRQGDVSAGEALLLSGALLEILEPDAQVREAELARWRRQFLPAARDDAS